MRQYSFGTFLVDDFNRNAFDVCCAVAALKKTIPVPIVLLADKGCGKTHLLYSIVNRVRAGSAQTGLAFITAHQFPEQVRNLICDPAPVQQAQSAILLVDQLEQFDNLLEELEGVVRIFLDAGHAVVFASSVHPGRLANLPAGLRELLDNGQLVEIVPPSSETRIEILRRQIRHDTDELISRQQKEIETLRDQLEQMPKTPVHSIHPNINEPVDTEIRQELVQRIAERDQVLEQLAEAKHEVEHLSAELALMAVSSKEARMLRDRLESARAENARLKEERAGRGENPAPQEPTDDVSALRRQLEQAREESATARSQANQMLARAESLLKEVEESRARFAQVQQDPHKQLAELRKILEQYAVAETTVLETDGIRAELDDVCKQLSSLRISFDEQRKKYQKALDEARRETVEAVEAKRSIKQELKQALDRCQSLELNVSQLSAELAAKESQVQTINHVAAEQVAVANAHAVEVESKLEELSEKFESVQKLGGDLVSKLGLLRNHLSQLTEESVSVGMVATSFEQAMQKSAGKPVIPHQEWTPPHLEEPTAPVESEESLTEEETEETHASKTDDRAFRIVPIPERASESDTNIIYPDANRPTFDFTPEQPTSAQTSRMLDEFGLPSSALFRFEDADPFLKRADPSI